METETENNEQPTEAAPTGAVEVEAAMAVREMMQELVASRALLKELLEERTSLLHAVAKQRQEIAALTRVVVDLEDTGEEADEADAEPPPLVVQYNALRASLGRNV
jgi:hypothetical protein